MTTLLERTPSTVAHEMFAAYDEVAGPTWKIVETTLEPAGASVAAFALPTAYPDNALALRHPFVNETIPKWSGYAAELADASSWLFAHCDSRALAGTSHALWYVGAPSVGQPALDTISVIYTGQDFDVSPVVQKIIEERGLTRIRRFANMDRGWDGGVGESLRADSVAGVNRFFAGTSLRPTNVAVFMSVEGNLVLSWFDRSGGLIELEFLADRVEYFIEQTGDEQSATYDDLGPLSEKIRSVS